MSNYRRNQNNNNCYNNNFNEFGQETFNRFNDLGHHVVGSLFEMGLPILNNMSNTNFNNPITKPEWYPFSDIKETSTEIKILVSIPGVEKESIDVTLTNGNLNIVASTSIGNNLEWTHIKERKYVKSFNIPNYITQSNLQIKYENGILRITVHKNTSTGPPGEKIPVD